jgi:hypothetical protein
MTLSDSGDFLRGCLEQGEAGVQSVEVLGVKDTIAGSDMREDVFGRYEH